MVKWDHGRYGTLHQGAFNQSERHIKKKKKKRAKNKVASNLIGGQNLTLALIGKRVSGDILTLFLVIYIFSLTWYILTSHKGRPKSHLNQENITECVFH